MFFHVLKHSGVETYGKIGDIIVHLLHLVSTLMPSPTYRPYPRLRAVTHPHQLSSHCDHTNISSDYTSVTERGATDGRSQDFPLSYYYCVRL